MKNKLPYKPIVGLRILCKDCKFEIHNIKEELKTNCLHPISRQVYKAVITDNNGKRRTKNLIARTLKEADLELSQFKISVENQTPTSNDIQTNYERPKIPIEKTNKPLLLIEAVALFYNALDEVDTVKFKKKHISQDVIKAYKRHIKIFLTFLKNKKINLKTFEISFIDDNIVDEYYSFVQKKINSNFTHNHYFQPLSRLINFLIKSKLFDKQNPFNGTLRKTQSHPKVVNKLEFTSLIEVIENSKNGSYKNYHKERKNMYRPWLKESIQFAAYTGCRREDIIMAKWSDIYFEDEKPLLLLIPDHKYNKKYNLTRPEEIKVTIIPIINELMELLIELGYEKYKDSNKFIVATEIDITRSKSMMDLMSKGCSHFFSLINNKHNLTFNNFRDNYMTKYRRATSGSAIGRSGHSSESVLNKHYYDYIHINIEIAMSDFRIFPE